jgi:hypothetical protein
LETTADHQVQNEEVVITETEDHPLSDPFDIAQHRAFNRFDRGIGRSEQEGVSDANLPESLILREVEQPFDVDDDLRVFGHWYNLPSGPPKLVSGKPARMSLPPDARYHPTAMPQTRGY